MITRGHMQHVKNRLAAMERKLVAGLPSQNSQCVEETFKEIKTLLAYATQKLEED